MVLLCLLCSTAAPCKYSLNSPSFVFWVDRAGIPLQAGGIGGMSVHLGLPLEIQKLETQRWRSL